jgi:hypothetical protein
VNRTLVFITLIQFSDRKAGVESRLCIGHVRELSGDNSLKVILNSNATSSSTNQDKDRIS